MFKAIYIDQIENTPSTTLTQLDESALPEGDVTIAVEYSTLNYKDALAITGQRPVVKKYPMVPGIDYAGRVTQSCDTRFAVGDQVFLNGWGVGELHWGGLAQYARGKADWFLPLPKSLSSHDVMDLGTAGYTAMLCVQTLEEHGITPSKGEVLVTGASGGVGSIAIQLLTKRGYSVVASTSVSGDNSCFTDLGAQDILDREVLSKPGRPLEKVRWSGAIDVVGGPTLANVCASTQYGGVVTACGMAQGMEIPLTVAPFILRGISLIGIDSVYCPLEKRQAVWDALEAEWDVTARKHTTTCIPLSDVIGQAHALLHGKVHGRIVVDVNA